MTDEDYTFPNCMHALASAMHRHNINPAAMTITLPYDEWWRLWCALEARFRGMMIFDGRGSRPSEFSYMGFKFKVEK